MVGVTGFEPATLCTQNTRTSRAVLHSVELTITIPISAKKSSRFFGFHNQHVENFFIDILSK